MREEIPFKKIWWSGWWQREEREEDQTLGMRGKLIYLGVGCQKWWKQQELKFWWPRLLTVRLLRQAPMHTRMYQHTPRLHTDIVTHPQSSWTRTLSSISPYREVSPCCDAWDVFLSFPRIAQMLRLLAGRGNIKDRSLRQRADSVSREATCMRCITIKSDGGHESEIWAQSNQAAR